MEPVENLANEMRREFGGDGWQITLLRLGGDSHKWSLGVEHPLSGDHSLTLGGPDVEADLQSIRDFFARREFEIVRQRPSAMPHLALIGSLRQLMIGHSLDGRVAVSLARVLCAYDVITLAEAHWLESAGPAWAA